MDRPTFPTGDGHPGPPPAIAGLPVQALRPLPTALVVGYPAPQAVEIVARLLATDGGMIACVVTPERWAQASRHAAALGSPERLRLFEGSAARPGLGLHRRAWRLLDTVGQIWGVASPDDIASGHLQDFADECPRLRELHLVPATASDDAPASGSMWAAVRQRAWTRPAAVAVALVGAVVALAVRTDRSLVDLETGLSWEDVERDLWPGLGTTG